MVRWSSWSVSRFVSRDAAEALQCVVWPPCGTGYSVCAAGEETEGSILSKMQRGNQYSTYLLEPVISVMVSKRFGLTASSDSGLGFATPKIGEALSPFQKQS